MSPQTFVAISWAPGRRSARDKLSAETNWNDLQPPSSELSLRGLRHINSQHKASQTKNRSWPHASIVSRRDRGGECSPAEIDQGRYGRVDAGLSRMNGILKGFEGGGWTFQTRAMGWAKAQRQERVLVWGCELLWVTGLWRPCMPGWETFLDFLP